MDAAEGVLRAAKTIAVVGISADPERPSYDVASYLMEHGYGIVPVNPNIGEWRGLKAYPSLESIPRDEVPDGVDVVCIFRKSGDVPPVVDGAIAIGAKAVWMQLGIVNGEAAEKARKAGLRVVMDRCMKIEHSKMG